MNILLTSFGKWVANKRFGLVVLVMTAMLPGCATNQMAKNGRPTSILFANATSCLSIAAKTLTPESAKDFCLQLRDKEVAREKNAVDATATAIASGRTFNPNYDPQGYYMGNRNFAPSTSYYGSYRGAEVIPSGVPIPGPDGGNVVLCNGPRCM